MAKTKALDEIERVDRALSEHSKSRLALENSLSRSLVSFQANKSRPVYRWYKFKEAFSASLVEYLFVKYKISRGTLLDTALFAASEAGMNAERIELLPIGQQIIATKILFDAEFTTEDIATLKRWAQQKLTTKHRRYS
jgi:hypothetical protein